MTTIEFPRTTPVELDPNDEDIEFQITDWYIPESDRANDYYRRKAGYPRIEGDPAVYDICMFGSTISGDSVFVKVTGFEPYFFVKIPEEWQAKGKPFMKSKVAALETTLKFEKVQRTKVNYETKKRETYMSSVIPNRLMDHLVSFDIIERKEFWGFTNGELFPFIRVKVKSLALFNILKRFFLEPAQVALGLKSYESNIDPFLRFIHERNIKPCGWVRLPAKRYTHLECDPESGDPVSRCGYNLTASYKNVFSEDINKIAPLLIASFDIECSSSHGDFPVAKKDYRKLATDIIAALKDDGTRMTKENILYWICDAYTKDTYISSDITISKLYTLDKVSVKKHVMPILEKHIDEIVRLVSVAANVVYNEDGLDDGDGGDDGGDAADSSAPVVAKRKTGMFNDDEDGPMGDLIKYFTKIKLPKLAGDKVIQIGTTVTRFGSDEIVYKNIITLNTCDPINGADVEAYEAEDEVIMAWKELLKKLDPDILTGYNIFGFDMKYVWERAEELGIDEHLAVGLGRINNRRTILDTKELSSAALGNNLMYFFDLDGVVNIDMYKVMQRDHKLDSYKLDSVASVFLGDKKDDISPAQIFSKFYGSSADRCEVARYCIQDCALVNRLLSKLKVLENNVAMGNVCSVPLSYLFMRGQGIKIFSLVAKESRCNKTLIPVIKSSFGSNESIDDEGYEGAIVLDPQEGMYLEDPIVVLDYNSLYPSSMISRNLSHDSYVADPNSKYAKMQDKGITYETVTYDVYEGKGDAKKVVGKRDCIFAQFPDGKKGIIPMILQNLLNQRKNTRKRMEYETLTLSDGRVAVGLVSDLGNGQLEILNVDKANIGEGFGGHKATIESILVVERNDTYNKFEQAVLDALQLAYKVTANSLYGQTGSRTSPIYLKEIAACTTATGREMIYLAKDFVEKRYGASVIYGDTDSIFIRFSHKDSDGNIVKGKEALPLAIKAGQLVEKEIKAIMPNSQNLAYEKTLWPFIILSKKRYVGNLYEDNINKFKQKSMGIVLKRRDNAPIVKTVYGGIIDTLLNKGDFLGSVEFLQNKLQEMVTGQVSLEDLIISKTLRASYKDPSKIAHKVLAKRMGERDAGNKPQANDRIPFVFIKTPEGVEIKLQGDRIEHPDYIRAEALTPDYYHYITNQLIKPISQIYALCVEKLPGYTYPPSYWEQMDIEMSDQKMYTDEKKRKKRIQALKQREVEDLLFSKYLDILKPNRNVRAYKKRHVLDLDKNKTIDETKDQYVLTINCDKVTKEKPAKDKTKDKVVVKNTETTKGAVWKLTLVLTNSTQQTEIFKEDLLINKKKELAYIRAAEHGFKNIYLNHKNIIDTGKLVVKTDAIFITKWKLAYKNIHLLQEKMQTIMTQCDAGLLGELQEIESIVNLIGFRDKIAYTLECI